jgi:hypothetical protein
MSEMERDGFLEKDFDFSEAVKNLYFKELKKEHKNNSEPEKESEKKS